MYQSTDQIKKDSQVNVKVDLDPFSALTPPTIITKEEAPAIMSEFLERKNSEGCWHEFLEHPDCFDELNRPIFLPNKDENSLPLVAVTGLANSSQVLAPTVKDYDDLTGGGGSLEALAHHDGTWESLQNVRHTNWPNQFEAMINKFPHQPVIGLGHSTGCMALIEHARQNPEKYAGIILIAPPIQLKSKLNQYLLAGGKAINDYAEQYARYILNDHRFDIPRNYDERTPMENLPLGYHKVTGRLLVCFETIRRLGKRAFRAISKSKPDLPVLLIQGDQDKTVLASSSFNFIKKHPNSMMHGVENGGHRVHVGEKQNEINGKIAKFAADCKVRLATSH